MRLSTKLRRAQPSRALDAVVKLMQGLETTHEGTRELLAQAAAEMGTEWKLWGNRDQLEALKAGLPAELDTLTH